METHSTNGASSALFVSERTFRMWRYGVGHSQLLLRSVPTLEHDYCLDVLFEDVLAMKMLRRYESIAIRFSKVEEIVETSRYFGINELQVAEFMSLTLDSKIGFGLVLCKTVTAYRGGSDPVEKGGEPSGDHILWDQRI